MSNVLINNTYEVLTPDGWSDFKGLSIKSETFIYKIYIKNAKIKCNNKHKLLTNDGFKQADALMVGDLLYHNDALKPITKITKKNIELDVYDLYEVEKNHQYYTEDFISHNCLEFQGSSGTLISGNALKALSEETPLIHDPFLFQFEKADPSKNYLLVADVSEGKGLDYSVFSVFDITQIPYRQVCTYRNNLITPTDFASVIEHIGQTYNNAYVLVESNSIGHAVCEILFDDEYENLIYTINKGRKGKQVTIGGGNTDFGIRTTTQVKALGCSTLKLLIEEEKLKVVDINTIAELTTFSRKGRSWEAEPGNNDDMVMTLVLFAWLSLQPFFKELSDTDVLRSFRSIEKQQMEDDMMPFGFVNNGMEEDYEEELGERIEILDFYYDGYQF